MKHWADNGQLRVERTAGGHRRVSTVEAVRFIREGGFSVVDPAAIGLRPGKANSGLGLTESLYESLLSGDASGFYGLLMKAYLSGEHLGTLFDGPVTMAMREVGNQWHRDDGGIHE